MLVFINQEPKEVEKNISLLNIIQSSLNSLDGLAVAVNNKVIPKSEWHKYTVKENDKLLFIRATQGG